jgi:hypothetical protein
MENKGLFRKDWHAELGMEVEELLLDQMACA